MSEVAADLDIFREDVRWSKVKGVDDMDFAIFAGTKAVGYTIVGADPGLHGMSMMLHNIHASHLDDLAQGMAKEDSARRTSCFKT
jgi:hypothetical protein